MYVAQNNFLSYSQLLLVSVCEFKQSLQFLYVDLVKNTYTLKLIINVLVNKR